MSAAAFPACSGEPSDPPDPGKGTIVCRVTGLAGAASGGSATGGLASGGPTVTFTMPTPNGGESVGNVPNLDPGVYNVTYVPPSTHQLVAGEPGTKQVDLAADETETVTFACEPVPTGGAGIQGQVTVQGSAVGLVGGTVQVLAGSTVVASIGVGAGGNFSGAVAAGSYTVKYHPPSTHSLGDAEPDTRPATIGSSTVTVNFTAKASLLYDSFQGYASDANLRSGGLVVPGVSDQNGGWANASSIFLDPTGGPTGGKAMRYDWGARASSGCNNDITIRAQMRFNPIRSGPNWYFRWREKMTNPWQNGSQASCPSGQWEYKFLRFIAGGGNGVYEILMPHGHGTGNPNPNLVMNLVMSDSTTHNTSNALQSNELNLGNPAVWPGAYRLFVLEIRGHGTADPTMALYIDGVQVKTLARVSGAAFAWNNNNFGFLELGANLDSGPDSVQSRWFGEFGIYDTRPALV